MLLKMQTQEKIRKLEKDRESPQSQRNRQIVTFSEKLRSKRSQANSNHAKIRKIRKLDLGELKSLVLHL